MKSGIVKPGRSVSDELRRGVTIVDVLVGLAVVGLLLSLAWPWIVSAREAARRNSCQHNMRLLAGALNSYHDTHGRFPPAAVWNTTALDSLALNHSRRIDLFTQTNWALALLPFVGETELASQFHSDQPIAASQNSVVRNSNLGLMACPSDTFNTAENPYRFSPDDVTETTFARGNFAINGGSQCPKDGPGSTSFRTGDPAHLLMDRTTREFRYWGNGVAGFNMSFARDDFVNGSSSLVALDEIRAGVHSIDPRGVWSLGQIGGSVTWAHGVNGDAYAPNNPHRKSDDLLDGDRINSTVGAAKLSKLGMPCVDYVNFNSQATSRSLHPGGVNVAMVDGSVRFIANEIDPGLWHVMHSRETPRSILNGLDTLISQSLVHQEKRPEAGGVSKGSRVERFENSLGMEFVQIPAGEFEMGIPDAGNSHDLPPECPQHTVQLSRSFHLGTHEVTQAQYLQVMGKPPAGEQSAESPSTLAESLPVVNVTWDEADQFCKTLTSRDAERAASRRYRLPTEAEWEYACRAGNHRAYAWSFSRENSDSGETAGIEPSLPLVPVKSYPPNPFGLYDMRGNAWEWCADWFDRTYYRRSPPVDPLGPQTGYVKVVRGGDWTFIGEGCKLSYAPMLPWKSNPYIGFRIVCENETK